MCSTVQDFAMEILIVITSTFNFQKELLNSPDTLGIAIHK